MAEPERKPTEPYASIRDLPSVAEMLRTLDGLGILSRIFMGVQDPEVKRLSAELDGIVAAVDGFYEVLGPRNWIFHESLSLDVGKEIAGAVPDVAEARLIEVYRERETLSSMIRRVRSHRAMHPWREQLERAQEDFEAERYYALALVLLTVMDGFVNELDPAERRGLHARDADDMVAWNSVVGHHLGLTRAHPTFVKGFYKVSDEEVHELYRNGIVHGNLTNFNNVVVAAKAWNRLFAAGDWAKSREEAAKPPKPEPTLGDLLEQVKQTERVQRDAAGFDTEPVFEAAMAFLSAWEKRNYGVMAGMLARNSLEFDESRGKAAGNVRDDYQLLELEAFEIKALDFQAAVICEVEVELTCEGARRCAWLRCIREDENGNPALNGEPGEWRVMSWGPHAFFNRRATD
jgi:hypothetical protein